MIDPAPLMGPREMAGTILVGGLLVFMLVMAWVS